MNGEATCYYADGGSYKGSFKNDEKVSGEMIYSNGDTYEGSWCFDDSNNGKFTWFEDGSKYDGFWNSDN